MSPFRFGAGTAKRTVIGAVLFLSLSSMSATPVIGDATNDYRIDLARYFPSPQSELQSRTALLRDVAAFAGSPVPRDARMLLAWLRQYDTLLQALERHDLYVYVRAEEDDRDVSDAKADDALAQAESRIDDRVAEAARQIGASRIAALTQLPSLAPYRYLLNRALAQSAHRLDAAEARSVALAVTPVLDSAASTYKALRKSGASLDANQNAYAALLVAIASARNGVASLRGFEGAAAAAYFDRSIDAASVERTLKAVRASTTYAAYRRLAAALPKTEFTPPKLPVADALRVIVAAEQPMGPEYAGAYEQLFAAASRRLEICTAPHCDDTGFSVGFAGLESAVFFGSYDGATHAVRAVAHEAGHAVHRQFMSRFQPIAAYNRGPSFAFESFAIFNELLLLDHLYRQAPDRARRLYYLNYFLDDATFQVFGSAEETDLESSIYRGVADGSIKTAADLDGLSSHVFSRYDPDSAASSSTQLYWARDRLFFTDPLYDVNYLYAGLLALAYFRDFEANPRTFSAAYVALLKNGFDDSPAALEKRFLGIDMTNEAALVSTAAAVIGERTKTLREIERHGNDDADGGAKRERRRR